MKDKKKQNFLVTYIDGKGIEPLDGFDNYIVSAADKDEVDEIMDEHEETEGKEEYIRIVQPLNKIKRLSKEELTVRKAMEMIYDPERFKESIKLFELMLIQKKLNHKSVLELLSPFAQFLNKDKTIVDKNPTFGSLWNRAMEQVTNTKICGLSLRFLPNKCKPFGYKEQIYELWFVKSGHFKNVYSAIELRHGNGNIKYHSLIDLLEELKDVIPDLSTRLEMIMIQAM